MNRKRPTPQWLRNEAAAAAQRQRLAERRKAAVAWMGTRYIGHPDCPLHAYCPDKVREREARNGD